MTPDAALYHHWLGIDLKTAQKIVQAQQVDPWDRAEADWQTLEIYKAAVSRVTTLPGVTADPKILSGQPVIAGTRVPVELVLREYAAGCNTLEILSNYPSLPPDAVDTAIRYAQTLPLEHPLSQLLQKFRANCG